MAQISREEVEEAVRIRKPLIGRDMREIGLKGVNLQGIVMERCDLTGARLDGAHLDGAILLNCTLDNAILREATIREGMIKGGSLECCDLSDTVMIEITIAQLKLHKTLLGEANMLMPS